MLICYCFEYTVDDIKADFHKNGESLILKKIINEKELGGCRCYLKNPSGK